jgi:hypothetical protein
VYYQHICLGREPQEIHQILFPPGDERAISSERMIRVCRDIVHHVRYGTIGLFLSGPRRRSGRQRILSPFEESYLKTLIEDNRFNRIAGEFYRHIGGHRPSLETLRRSRSLFSRVMAPISANRIVNIDETAASPDQYKETYGYALKGDKCYKRQFKIGGRHFSVLAAYTVHGFIAWRIFEGPVSSVEFALFMAGDVAPLLQQAFHFVIVDNCSVHKTDAAIDALIFAT